MGVLSGVRLRNQNRRCVHGRFSSQRNHAPQGAAAESLTPGLAVTLLLVRKVAWTAAVISGIDLLSQSLADHELSALPVARHLATTVPGSGVTALRLYRLATIAAEACCPIRR